MSEPLPPDPDIRMLHIMREFKPIALVLVAQIGLGILTSTAALAQIPRVVGSFDQTVSGGTSLAGGGTLVNGARSALLATFPNVALSPTSSITQTYLDTVDVFVLVSATGATSPITRSLTLGEQAALSAFVLAGGAVAIYVDNSTFTSTAPAVHSSFLSPFGMAVSGTIVGRIPATVPSSVTHPVVSGPYGSVASFDTIYPGVLSQLGAATPLAFHGVSPSQSLLAILSSGDAIPAGLIQGRVVVFGDCNSLFDQSQSGVYPGPVFSLSGNTAVFLNSMEWLLDRASYRLFARGCPGHLGVPTNRAASLPILGAPLTMVIGNVPLPEAAILALGLSNVTCPLGPLPIDLGAMGAPGCTLSVSPDALIFQLGSGGNVSISQSFPNAAWLTSIPIFVQAFVLDQGINTLGLVSSDAAVIAFR